MSSIPSDWQKIASWYEANTPPQKLLLSSGATETEITRLEHEIGFRLPEDVRESFAIHNGAQNDGSLLHYGDLLPLERIAFWHREYSKWQKEDEWGSGENCKVRENAKAIKPLWWSPLRLPLTDNSGSSVMLDFDPAETGRWGQIIKFDHEIGPTEVLAPSFGDWLHSIAVALEDGEYIYHEDEETVAPRDMRW